MFFKTIFSYIIIICNAHNNDCKKQELDMFNTLLVSYVTLLSHGLQLMILDVKDD